MKIPCSLVFVGVVFLAGCATTAPREILARPGKSAIVTAFEPVVRGMNVGTTVFQNRSWESRIDEFNLNESAAKAVSQALLNPVEVINGETAGLGFSRAGGDKSDALAGRLVELAEAQKADRIVVIESSSTGDAIAGTNQILRGVGVYRREFLGMRRVQVYGVFSLRVFDVASRSWSTSKKVLGSREVYAIEWHEGWLEFSPAERKRLVAAWTELMNEKTAELLSEAGLAQEAVVQKSSGVASIFVNQKNRPQSWLPEGNVLPIPEGVSPAEAASAVVRGLKARGWTLISESENRVVGVYRSGAKEAGVRATLSSAEITLEPDDYEIKADGSRVRVEPYARWQNNLKESIYRELLDAEAALLPALPAKK